MNKRSQIGLITWLFCVCSLGHSLTPDAWPGQERMAGYSVGFETTLRKVFRDPGRFQGEICDSVCIHAARNEYEGFQLCIFAQEVPVADIRLEFTDLTNYGENRVIQSHNIKWFVVGYVKTKTPIYPVDYVGMWPDPLLPQSDFDVRPNEVQPIWVTVYVPNDAPAGRYEGQVRIIPRNGLTKTADVVLNVWGFSLPKETHIRTAFSLYENCIREYYGYDRIPREIREEFYTFLLEHRLNPSNLYLTKLKPQPTSEWFSFCLERGMNAFNIAYLYDWENNEGDQGYFSSEYERQLVDYLENQGTRLRRDGLLHMAYVFGPDEPRPRVFESMKDILGLVGETVPGLKRMVTVTPRKYLFDYIDIWVIRPSWFDQNVCRERQKAGDEIWFYVCAMPWHPYPNFFIDYPAIDHRILFWMCWKYGITGFQYYSTNRWVTNYPSDGSRWPDIPWNTFTFRLYNGDGHLIYPGPDGKPWGSVRLEIIRDGIEDYEYFWLLKNMFEKVEAKEERLGGSLADQCQLLLEIEADIVQSPKSYTSNLRLIANRRIELGRALEQMAQLLD